MECVATFKNTVLPLLAGPDCTTRVEFIKSALKIPRNLWAFEHIFGKGMDWDHVDHGQILEVMEDCTLHNDGIELYWTVLPARFFH